MNNEISNFLYLTKTYLENANIYIDEDYLEINLLSNSNFPGIVSIIQILDLLKIRSSIYEIEKNKIGLDELPDTFLTMVVDLQNKNTLVIAKNKSDSIEIRFSKSVSRTVSYQEFFDHWCSLVILIDDKESYLPFLYNKVVFSFKAFMYYSFFIFLVYFFIKLNPSLYCFYHFILSLFGLFISYLIYSSEVGYKFHIINKICTPFKKSNCEEVVNSKGGVIFKKIKLSDLSLVYFFSLAITTCMMKYFDINSSGLLTILNILTIPLIFYSLFYQLRVLKKWCPLCMIIITILLIQIVITNGDVSNRALQFNIESIYTFLVMSLFSCIGFNYYKKQVYLRQELKDIKIKHNKFKQNFSLFHSALSSSKVLTLFDSEIEEIVVGNKDSKLNITIVINPLCDECGKTHLILNEIIQKHYDEITLTIRFYLFYDDVNDVEFLISNYLLNIYKLKGENVFLEKMNGMFECNDKDKWISEETKDTLLEKSEGFIIEKEWCNQNEINFTPAIVINNHLFPSDLYEIADLDFFIEDLIDLNQTQ
ncbi:hypothetical protein B8T70_08280 [Flavobacterium sp. AJR]|uniref:vitamin K epoxide reductase family protein n=1 Tax=Flavobacterium sp. KMS TaxID=1566023 RepID=UPI0009DEA502|nr:vitamin K epoxide reductase family protein [Flavobacterium sp. KMS]OUL62833.1 hypothetical protein B8T70_08280 [Flavobacterium sp. AJR]